MTKRSILSTFQHWFYSNQIKLLLHSLYYTETCSEFAGLVFCAISPTVNTAPFKEMSQRWRAVGNAVPNLTRPRFEPQTSRSRDERVAARATGIRGNIALFWRIMSENAPMLIVNGKWLQNDRNTTYLTVTFFQTMEEMALALSYCFAYLFSLF